MASASLPSRRTGARRMSDVPAAVRTQLAAGECETVNLMEWLATDMAALARAVAGKLGNAVVASNLMAGADRVSGLGVLARLKVLGKAIATAAPPGSPAFVELALHPSDVVRQWACYAVNDDHHAPPLSSRLEQTLVFAADSNMSVREAAWMAFRPHVAAQFDQAMPMLTRLAAHDNANVRRFAVEITRPRSVWGAHLERLKQDPGLANELLAKVLGDETRYVQLAVGNWLNDASKTRPEWVRDFISQRLDDRNRHTDFMIRRGLRTLNRKPAFAADCLL